jgi:DNA-binding transcriptional regulator YdaS (Cro superfamily)
MKSVLLTIEKSRGGTIWGRVECEDNLLVDSAKSIEALERKFKKLLKAFHDVDPERIKFTIAHDLTSFFEANNFLNISAIADKVGMNPGLLRQYTSGTKTPSPQTANKIERVIHGIARELATVRIGTRSTRGEKSPSVKRKRQLA